MKLELIDRSVEIGKRAKIHHCDAGQVGRFGAPRKVDVLKRLKWVPFEPA